MVTHLPVLHVELEGADFQAVVHAGDKLRNRGPHLLVGHEEGVAEQDLEHVVIVGDKKTASHHDLSLIHLEEEALSLPVDVECPQLPLLEMIHDQLEGGGVVAACVVVFHGGGVG